MWFSSWHRSSLFATAVVMSKGKSVAMSSAGHSAGASPTDGGADPLSMSETPCAMQPGVLPLLGRPYFTCILCKSHVNQPFQVVLLLLICSCACIAFAETESRKRLPRDAWMSMTKQTPWVCLAAGGAQVAGAVPPGDHGAGDGDAARPVLGDAVHGGAADPAPGGRVAGLRAGQRPHARRRVRLRAARRQAGGRGVQGAGAPRPHPRGDPGARRRVHLVHPHPHRLAHPTAAVLCIPRVLRPSVCHC